MKLSAMKETCSSTQIGGNREHSPMAEPPSSLIRRTGASHSERLRPTIGRKRLDCDHDCVQRMDRKIASAMNDASWDERCHSSRNPRANLLKSSRRQTILPFFTSRILICELFRLPQRAVASTSPQTSDIGKATRARTGKVTLSSSRSPTLTVPGRLPVKVKTCGISNASRSGP